jgi:hypothetical protein
MTATDLREKWKTESALRGEWDAILQTKAWKFVASMIELEEIERAEAYDTRVDADPILARNLAGLKGARRVLLSLTNACTADLAPIQDIEEFAHIEPNP